MVLLQSGRGRGRELDRGNEVFVVVGVVVMVVVVLAVMVAVMVLEVVEVFMNNLLNYGIDLSMKIT